MKLKKIIGIFFVLSGLLLIAGCAGKADVSEKRQEKQAEKTRKDTVIYVVRHGKTMLNEAKRAQGWSDTPLTDEGEKVTKELARGLKKRGIRFDYAYTSDLGRTRQTAGIILKGLGQPELSLREQQGLREVCFGTYEGEKFSKMMEDVSRHLGYESLKQFKQSGTYHIKKRIDGVKRIDKTGYAESFKDVKARMQKSLRNIAKDTEKKGGGNVLVVSHGMAIVTMLFDMTEQKVPGRLENSSVTKIIYKNGSFTVQSIGDTTYLEQ